MTRLEILVAASNASFFAISKTLQVIKFDDSTDVLISVNPQNLESFLHALRFVENYDAIYVTGVDELSDEGSTATDAIVNKHGFGTGSDFARVQEAIFNNSVLAKEKASGSAEDDGDPLKPPLADEEDTA